jgi:hypothetical protein
MDLKERLGSADWTRLAQDGKMASCCEHGNEHSGYMKCEIL